MRVKNPHAESLRIPAQRSSAQGESAPKVRLKSVADGKQVNIPVLFSTAKGGRRRLGPPGGWLSWFKRVGGVHREIRAHVKLRRDEELLKSSGRG